jgi:Cu(I)/Ag(I) efflux system membrane fusion protein
VKRLAWSVLVLAAMSAAGIGGYRIGRHGVALPSMAATAADRARGDGPVIYYQHPDGKPFYSAKPKTTPDGRSWRAVHADEDIGFDGDDKVDAKTVAETSGSRKILYYRNPMGLPDISKVPKKDAMGMD